MGRPLGGQVGRRDLQLLLWSSSSGGPTLLFPSHVLHVSELTPSPPPPTPVTLRSVFASPHHSPHHSPPHKRLPRSLSSLLPNSCLSHLMHPKADKYSFHCPAPPSLFFGWPRAAHPSRLGLSIFFGVKSFLTGTGHLLSLTSHHRRGPPWMLKPLRTVRLGGASQLQGTVHSSQSVCEGCLQELCSAQPVQLHMMVLKAFHRL